MELYGVGIWQGPNPDCTPERLVQQAAAMQQTLGSLKAVWAEGHTVFFSDLSLPLLVLNSTNEEEL